MTQDYDRGFNDGLKWVAECLRGAASRVEAPIYADYERPAGNGGEPRTYLAIARTGQTHLASKLRAVADEIEAAIHNAERPPHGPQT